MADIIVEKEEIVKKKSEPLFSKKNRRILIDPLDGDNPITVQVLGICSALAITAQMQPSLVMSLSVVFVMAGSSVLISLLSRTIPKSIRIVVQLSVIAVFVILVDQILQAFLFDMAQRLGAFIGLIITNCIVMGRLEAFAGNPENTTWSAFLDAIGNAAGYGIILMIVAFFRELFGSGTIFGFEVLNPIMGLFGAEYQGNGLMLLPAGACVIVGIIIWVQRALNGYAEEE